MADEKKEKILSEVTSSYWQTERKQPISQQAAATNKHDLRNNQTWRK